MRFEITSRIMTRIEITSEIIMRIEITSIEGLRLPRGHFQQPAFWFHSMWFLASWIWWERKLFDYEFVWWQRLWWNYGRFPWCTLLCFWGWESLWCWLRYWESLCCWWWEILPRDSKVVDGVWEVREEGLHLPVSGWNPSLYAFTISTFVFENTIICFHHVYLCLCRLADDRAVKVEDVLVEVEQQIQLRPWSVS